MWGGLVHTLASDKVPRAEHLDHVKLDVIQSSDMRPLFEELGMHRHCMAILQCLDTQHAPLAWHQCCLCAYHSLGVQLKVAVFEIFLLINILPGCHVLVTLAGILCTVLYGGYR